MTKILMPKPTDLIDTADGGCIAAMFFYIEEDTPLVTAQYIAVGHGFDVAYVELTEARDPELAERYEDGENILSDWSPASPVPGCLFAGKWDTENGPVSIWLRPRD